MRKSWTRENIIRQLLAREGNGLPLAVSGLGADKAMYSAARRIFGSWRNAILAAGIAPQEVMIWERWSPAKILVMIRHLARRNRPLTTQQMRKRHYNVVSAARRHFGSWNKAILAAGVDPSKLRRVVPWTPERVIEGILTRALRNESLAARLVEPRSLIEAGHRFFGSWHGAIQAAGLDRATITLEVGRNKRGDSSGARASGKKISGIPRLFWDKDRVIAAMRLRLAERRPMHCTALAREDQRLYNAIRRYFGGWKEAMRAVGLDPAAHRMAQSGRKASSIGERRLAAAQESLLTDQLRPDRPV
jgi:hypothetical protein